MAGTFTDPGINTRALTCLFENAEMGRYKRGWWRYKIEVSALEIYNESVRDLLAPRRANAAEPPLELRQGPEGVHVPGAKCVEVDDLRGVMKALRQSMAARTTAATG